MPTQVLAYWNNKESRIEIDIDANVRLTAIRWVGENAATVTLATPDRSRTYTLGRNIRERSVPTGVAGRIQLTYDAERDRYDGLTGEVLSEG